MSTRNYPRESLEASLVVAQKVADENAGSPMNRLLVADALGVKPASSNFRYLLSASRSYGLTEGTEKAAEVSLTALGRDATQPDPAKRRIGLRRAVVQPEVFKRFFERFNQSKLPSPEMMAKILVADFAVPQNWAEECANLIKENGDYVGFIRSISGTPHVFLDDTVGEAIAADQSTVTGEADSDAGGSHDEVAEATTLDMQRESVDEQPPSPPETSPAAPKPIFVGHGKNRGPLAKLEKLLSTFQIPYKTAIDEANLGRPIPVKVKETMDDCGSAILIFTQDERFFDEKGDEVWRPSENVVHELGAASYAYGDRIVIFKEAGLRLASNFSSIGYIEFNEHGIEAKTAELLKELIGFGLVKVMPAA